MAYLKTISERRSSKVNQFFFPVLVNPVPTGFRGDSLRFQSFGVGDFGTWCNAVALDTSAIYRGLWAALRHCMGRVLFAAGPFLCGSIQLVSNIILHLYEAYTTLATRNDMKPDGCAESHSYDVRQDLDCNYWSSSLVQEENIHHVVIIGEVPIDGGGTTSENQVPDGEGEKVTIENLNVDTSGDNASVETCQNVRVLNCSVNSFHSGDIYLENRFAPGYECATQNVTIDDCIANEYDEDALVNISLIDEDGCRQIELETGSQGSFKYVTIPDNIVMGEYSTGPIFIRVGDCALKSDNPPVGSLKNVADSNVFVIGSYPKLSSIQIVYAVGMRFGTVLARFALRVGGSDNFPTVIKATELFPGKERALVTDVLNSGVKVCAVIAVAIVTWIVLVLGWREAFVFRLLVPRMEVAHI